VPRDYPDGAAPIYQVAVKQSDLGQLFLAMTGFLPIDTRGRMVWLDTFTDGIQRWELRKAGDGQLPYWDITYPFVGARSVKLDSGTLAGGGSSTIRFWSFSSVAQRVGFEVMYRYAGGSGQLVLNLYWLTAALCRRGRLTVDPETGNVSVGPPSALVLVGNIGVPGAEAVWLPVKFVVDFDAQKLVRVLFGNTEIDLSDHATITTAMTGQNKLIFEANSYAWGTDPKVTYLGYGMVTLDEP